MSSFAFRGINFQVVDRGGHPMVKPMWGLEGARMTVTYRVANAARFTARRALLGSITFVSTPPQGGYFMRELPHAYEEGEGLMYCKTVAPSAEITANPTGDGLVAGKFTLLDAVYDIPPYDLLDDATVIGISGSGQPDEWTLARYVSFPPPKCKARPIQTKAATWKWTGVLLPSGRPKPVPSEMGSIAMSDGTFIFKWHQIPRAHIPFAAIISLLNTSNAVAFGPVPAGFGIFSEYGTEEIQMPDGSRGANLIYTVDFKTHGANKLPDPDRKFEFFAIESMDGAGGVPYPAANWNGLFIPS